MTNANEFDKINELLIERTAKIDVYKRQLLIGALLPEETLKEYLETAHSLGLSALVEAHDEAEVAQAMRAGARIIGVNNRNLKDFTVDRCV